jgi:DNA-binding MarR family transcriptional regulator
VVDRTQVLGLVARDRDPDDHRRVRLRLTREGDRVLRRLTEVHLEEIARLGKLFGRIGPGVRPRRR